MAKHVIQVNPDKSLEVDVISEEIKDEDSDIGEFISKHHSHGIVEHTSYVARGQMIWEFEGEVSRSDYVDSTKTVINNWEILECPVCNDALDVTNGHFYLNGVKLS